MKREGIQEATFCASILSSEFLSRSKTAMLLQFGKSVGNLLCALCFFFCLAGHVFTSSAGSTKSIIRCFTKAETLGVGCLSMFLSAFIMMTCALPKPFVINLKLLR